MKRISTIAIGIGALTTGMDVVGDGWDPASKATAIGSISQTRHNLTIAYNPDNVVIMDLERNNYGEICVYCHTPHGANTQIKAPIWNRTINASGYTIYDKPTTLMRPIGQPGPSSLTCLSCHDGTITIDSVLNMPGPGLAPGTGTTGANNLTGTSNIDFLNRWASNPFGLPSATLNHSTLGPELGEGNTTGTCALCHNTPIGSLTQSYRAFMIGTDLRNDHPVGVQFPVTFGPGIDFNEPNVREPGRIAFFDKNGNGHADTDEVRLYDTGEGFEVECASCHDPHGVPSGGSGSNTRFNPSFLRVNNGIVSNTENAAGTSGIISNGPSKLCLTCHAK